VRFLRLRQIVLPEWSILLQADLEVVFDGHTGKVTPATRDGCAFAHSSNSTRIRTAKEQYGSVMLRILVVALLLQTPTPTPQVITPQELAPGINLMRFAPIPGRGPDGNTTIIDAPDGLIVIDTGRHTFVTDNILAFAKEHKKPIVVIINTHWHLDHSSGNRRLKAAYPQARVYTTAAVDRALAPGGFLARNYENSKTQFSSVTDNVRREEMQLFFDTMENSAGLRPDVPLTTSGSIRLGGRTVDVRVTDKAVSDADAWIYDAGSRIAIIGDLITAPVPYFETACPDKWRAALDEVWATDCQTAVPGHGPPMTREQFNVYRQGFGEFVVCARSEKAPATCGTDWVERTASLIGDDPARRKAVAGNMEYYVGYLRSNGGKAPDCQAR
jgi:glyoxylase-like metal-dependent hydrolase (beta-lactamase superfamily II)